MEKGSGGDGERLFYGWWPGKGSVIGSGGYGSEGVMSYLREKFPRRTKEQM